MIFGDWRRWLNKLSRNNRGRTAGRKLARSARPRLEVLESRALMAVVFADSVGEMGGAPTATYNDYTIIQKALDDVQNGDTIELRGTIVTALGRGNAYGVNNSGLVVGQNAAGRAFSYSNGIATDLVTLGGDYSFALGVNYSGQVVGWAQSFGGSTRGFLYSSGSMTNLSPGSLTGGAQGINSSGQVVGWSLEFGAAPNGASMGPTHPYLYENGVTTELGSFPANSVS